MMANIWWSLPLTLIVFIAARKLAARYKFPLLNPLLVAMVVIIPFLMLTGISYDSYFKGSGNCKRSAATGGRRAGLSFI